MKKLWILLPALVVLASCGENKRAAERLQLENDSISAVLRERDAMVNGVFESLNAITRNLDEIKEREHVVTSSMSDGELNEEATVKINRDIAQIDALLKENKTTIAELQQKAAELKKANIRLASLDAMIKDLTSRVEAKDGEIAQLRASLQGAQAEVAALTGQVTTLDNTVASLNQQRTALEGEVKTKSDQLNTAYYIVGQQKELISSEIVYKSGFVGRTLKINENRSLDSFTQVDMREFDEVLIGKPNVTLVSSHPANSYEFVMSDKSVYSALIILDKKAFWELSKVLVVSYK